MSPCFLQLTTPYLQPNAQYTSRNITHTPQEPSNIPYPIYIFSSLDTTTSTQHTNLLLTTSQTSKLNPSLTSYKPHKTYTSTTHNYSKTPPLISPKTDHQTSITTTNLLIITTLNLSKTHTNLSKSIQTYSPLHPLNLSKTLYKSFQNHTNLLTITPLKPLQKPIQTHRNLLTITPLKPLQNPIQTSPR